MQEADILNHRQQDPMTEQQQQQNQTADDSTDEVRTPNRTRPRPYNEINENDQQPLRPLEEGETPSIQLLT